MLFPSGLAFLDAVRGKADMTEVSERAVQSDLAVFAEVYFFSTLPDERLQIE
jgi:hypothetical protein